MVQKFSRKQRFGGIYSALSQRDVNTIRNAEAYLLSDEDFGGDTPLEEGLDELSIDEIIDGVQLYIEYFQQERATGNMDWPGNYKEMIEWQKSLPPKGRAEWGERMGKSRYWEGKLLPVLLKLKGYQRRLQGEELN